MKWFKIGIPLLTLSCGLVLFSASKYKIEPSTEKGFVVVELFTSQGCSSCPPADKVLAKLSKENNSIYALAFHVDYWNNLGWKDPFSKAEYSNYQRTYAKKLNDRVYTPQMIVNGKTAFVGSKSVTAESLISKELNSNNKKVEIDLSAKFKNDKVEVQFQVKQPKLNYQLKLAFVEKEATTNIKSGENGGKTLKYTHIVRGFVSLTTNEGKQDFTLKKGRSANEYEVIAYYQNNENYSIVGANNIQLQ